MRAHLVLDGGSPTSATPGPVSVAPASSYAESFSTVYAALSKADKIDFLKALLTKNVSLLNAVLRCYSQFDADWSARFVSDTNILFVSSPREKLNDTLIALLQGQFAHENQDELLTLLLASFQGVPETCEMANGLHVISVKAKKELLALLLAKLPESVVSSMLSQLVDISYSPSLPALLPSPNADTYVRTLLSPADVRTAMRAQVDLSEFIILAIGLLQGCPDKIPGGFIADLTTDYIFTRYETAFDMIRLHCSARLKIDSSSVNKLLTLSSAQRDIFCTVLALSERIRPFHPSKNDPRRFFETRLGQYMAGSVYDDSGESKETLTAANNILCHFLGERGRVRTPEEVELAVSVFVNGYRDEKKYSPEEMKELRAQCTSFSMLDRAARPKEHDVVERKHELSPTHVRDSIWNSSGGALTSLSPTFTDARVHPPIRNMIVDAARKPSPDANKRQWSWQNDREYAAYVGSISGHICNMVVMLKQYMAAHRDDPNLSQDINLFLQQVLAVYVKKGYHSMLEVIDILHDKSVQDIFKKYNVAVNLDAYFRFEPAAKAFVDHAFNDALAYTKHRCLKRAVVCELSGVPLDEPTVPLRRSASH